jgi:hypothetical protein
VSRRGMGSAALALLVAASLCGQTAPTPPPMPKAPRAPGKAKTKDRPPVNFTGVWELDEKASQDVSNRMEGAVLSVKQNGNRIWIDPIEQKGPKLLGEQIVVDGRLYEKGIGGKKGTLQAQWGTDDQSLWLQVIAGNGEDPNAALQRSVWRLQDFGNTWTRQTWTINGEKSKVSYYVFRKRAAEKSPTPTPDPWKRTPKP